MARLVYTIGYSGYRPEAFLNKLREKEVKVVVDVRRYPRSKIPFYTAESLKTVLQGAGITYTWLGELGALGIKGPGAGCSTSPTFDAYVWRLRNHVPAVLQLQQLEELAYRSVVAILCREENWRHCHRQFIADYLTKRGFAVIHIRRHSEEAHEETDCYDTIG
ncbi:DUF488 family protein [Pyrobaculum sp.]|uniref:DUF488 family protein n=1 Tax=Pyrobaculum sp. TaxID=2004705 RepID=UPI0031698AF5